MYAKSGLLLSARRLFDEMPERDIPAWNSIIAGYARCGKLTEARDLFDRMPARNVVTWTAMISGYSQNGRFLEAVETFVRMGEQVNVRPNEVTVASILPACANLGALELGERINRYVRERGFLRNVFVGNSLMEMYAKCGRIDRARQVFEEIGGVRNLCSWNSMIMGLAVHGRWKEGLELFHDMLVSFFSYSFVGSIDTLLIFNHSKFWNVVVFFDIVNKLENFIYLRHLFFTQSLLQTAKHPLGRVFRFLFFFSFCIFKQFILVHVSIYMCKFCFCVHSLTKHLNCFVNTSQEELHLMILRL